MADIFRFNQIFTLEESMAQKQYAKWTEGLTKMNEIKDRSISHPCVVIWPISKSTTNILITHNNMIEWQPFIYKNNQHLPKLYKTEYSWQSWLFMKLT